MRRVPTEKALAGDNIRRLCEERGISIRRMSMDMKINRSWLHEIITGRGNTTTDMLSQIAKYFGVTVHELFRPAANGKGRKSKELAGARK